MTDQEKKDLNHQVDDNSVTSSHIEDDGSIHVVHKELNTTDDFVVKMVKSEAYKTMSNN